MSSPCASDSEDDKIITSSMEKRETLTRRKEAEPQKQKVTTQSGTTRSASKVLPLNFLKFWKNRDNPAGWAYNHVEHFILDSIRLIRRCTKPDAKEFKKITYACGIGFLLMGFIGYIVKLVFIPINNILVSE